MSSAVDRIFVAASSRDGRFTRTCVASIRYFYPEVPIDLLVGGPLERGLADELRRYWTVGIANVPKRDWGWGFVKLEPLFGTRGEKFLVLDSDTVCVGDVLRLWADCGADFLVDDEWQSQEDTERLYYDWKKVATHDSTALPAQFVFNSGQWFGTAGILKRDDFSRWIDWGGERPSLRHPEIFMPGDQGVLNYVVNQKFQRERLNVAKSKIMRWPGHGMDGITASTVATRTAPPVIVHWAGLKKMTIGAMPGADVLDFFERLYYARLPFRPLQRQLRAAGYFARAAKHEFGVRVKLRLEKYRRRLGLSHPAPVMADIAGGN